MSTVVNKKKTSKKPPTSKKTRSEHRTVRDDNSKKLSIGLQDIDETILYYFKNVIKPSVYQNKQTIEVPIIYGSPERWQSIQEKGHLRDKNGKLQPPLIVFKRDNIEKNRNLGNKLDANNPSNLMLFQKKFSNKNKYDKFSALSNRKPVKEYQGVVIPDYINITYSCIIFTEYVEHMNKIIESISYASDSYWGEPGRFTFRAMIDSYQPTVILNDKEDREVRTDFQIKLLGYIIPDTINAQMNGLNKTFSKSSVSFGMEIII